MSFPRTDVELTARRSRDDALARVGALETVVSSSCASGRRKQRDHPAGTPPSSHAARSCNLYLKRLVRKGLIKVSTCRSNRLLYLLTPKGISEKTRLTYEFMEYSLWLYKEARRQLHFALAPKIRSGTKRFAIYGTGEAAELAYLSLKEHGLEPAAIFDGTGTREFLGMRVYDISTHADIQFELMIVATLDNPQSLIDVLVEHGLTRDQLVTVGNADSDA